MVRGGTGQSSFSGPRAMGNMGETQTPLMGSAGWPANQPTRWVLQPLLGKDVPDGLDLAGGAGGGPNAFALGVRLGEPEDAVFVRALASGDGVPKHGGENRLHGGDIADDAAVDKGVEGRQEAFVEERIDVFPVSGVPADEEDLPGDGFRHRRSANL